MNVIKERNKWRKSYTDGVVPNVGWLLDYREKRDDKYFRISRNAELVCEYVLFLEDKIKELEYEKG